MFYSSMDTMFSSGSRRLRIVRIEGVFRLPLGLGDDILEPRQCGKRRELGGAVAHRHRWMLFRHMVRQMEDVVVVVHGHSRCPPICRFRSFAVAPSRRFIPLRMAFLPMRLLMSSTARCRRLSRSRSASSATRFLSSAS